jgi:hypothetical protein
MVCSHTEDTVVFPDGTRVLASGWLQRRTGEPTPDFGLYLDAQWTPTWPNVMLDWPDFGVPHNQATADERIRGAFDRARAGQRVEVACIGGHGRTGTVLACMAILAGVPPAEAVSWVRGAYCPRAVQEPSQQYWIDRYAERLSKKLKEVLCNGSALPRSTNCRNSGSGEVGAAVAGAFELEKAVDP